MIPPTPNTASITTTASITGTIGNRRVGGAASGGEPIVLPGVFGGGLPPVPSDGRAVAGGGVRTRGSDGGGVGALAPGSTPTNVPLFASSPSTGAVLRSASLKSVAISPAVW